MITISVILFLLLLCGCINCTNNTLLARATRNALAEGCITQKKVKWRFQIEK